eukprot:TRINITY_DN21127_c0_g1_i1.p1 TRINITY_DN21127_c0_g1~~TRINITY_DN21127_c0_g1_i1.p1  ORF type:complete len:754 (+),score=257.55 TRINITY_DN21127_c0_g1_i1:278-2539(+)
MQQPLPPQCTRGAADLVDAWTDLREVARGKCGKHELDHALNAVEVLLVEMLGVDLHNGLDPMPLKRRGTRVPKSKLLGRLARKHSHSSDSREVSEFARFDSGQSAVSKKEKKRSASTVTPNDTATPKAQGDARHKFGQRGGAISRSSSELALFLENEDKSQAEIMMMPARTCSLPDISEILVSEEGLARFRQLISMLPDKKLYQAPSPKVGLMTGPDDTEMQDCYGEFASAWTVSTYPRVLIEGQRQGDPICDRYNMQLRSNMVITALADGCNWGTKPQEAAILASNEVVSYLGARIDSIDSVRTLGKMLLKAFMGAHKKIIEPKEDVWDAGTTTLLGGALVRLAPSEGSRRKPWAFVCASVGDCKAFVYRHKEECFDEITKGNRSNLIDASDCGGRLGPYKNDGDPDLRNLSLYYTDLQRDDIVVIVSDGVHDNLDPQILGVDPKDVGLSIASWTDAHDDAATEEEVEDTKRTFMLDLLSRITSLALRDSEKSGSGKKKLTPNLITQALIRHARAITNSVRTYMEDHPSMKQPKDYQNFPGKMDHTSCLSFRVGRVDQHPFPSVESVLSDEHGKEQFRSFLVEADNTSGMTTKLAEGLRFIDDIAGLARREEEEAIPEAASNLFKAYLAGGRNEQLEISHRAVQEAVTGFKEALYSAQDELIARFARVYFPRFQQSRWMRYECFFKNAAGRGRGGGDQQSPDSPELLSSGDVTAATGAPSANGTTALATSTANGSASPPADGRSGDSGQGGE